MLTFCLVCFLPGWLWALLDLGLGWVGLGPDWQFGVSIGLDWLWVGWLWAWLALGWIGIFARLPFAESQRIQHSYFLVMHFIVHVFMLR